MLVLRLWILLWIGIFSMPLAGDFEFNGNPDDRNRQEDLRRQQNYQEISHGLAQVRACIDHGQAIATPNTTKPISPYPASPLPDGFRENFSPIGWLDRLFWHNSHWHEYLCDFESKLTREQLVPDTQTRLLAARGRMRQWGWYRYPAFVQFIQTLPEYEEYMLEIDAQLRCDPEFAHKVKGASEQAPAHITRTAQNIRDTKQATERERAAQKIEQEREAERARQEHQAHCTEVQEIYVQDRDAIQTHLEDDRFIQQLSQQAGCDIELRCTRRQEAFDAMSGNGVECIDQAYVLSPQAQQLLHAGGFLVHGYTNCYGNPLQHVIHEEIIEIAELTAQLTSAHLAHPYRHTLMDYIEAARIYNQDGLVDKAITMTDLCYSLLGYGVAVIRGAGQGVLDVAIDIVRNPVPVVITVGSMAFGVPVSTAIGGAIVLYYGTKLGVAVIDVGSAYVRDKERGWQKFDDYTAPLQEVIGIFADQKIETITKVQLGSRIASKIIAQQILFKGIRKTVTAVSVRAAPLVANSPDGSLITVSSETANLVGGHGLIRCPASCVQMHEYLKSSLRIEEFTSVIKVIRHGVQRLIERGFTPEATVDLIRNPHYIRIQSDGAKVFIQNVADRYKIIILNEKTNEVVTALTNTTLHKIENLGENYGWKL